jgi:hypothetical protein
MAEVAGAVAGEVAGAVAGAVGTGNLEIDAGDAGFTVLIGGACTLFVDVDIIIYVYISFLKI